MSVCYLATFYFNLGLEGLWIGIPCGLGFISLWYIIEISRAEWEDISLHAMESILKDGTRNFIRLSGADNNDL